MKPSLPQGTRDFDASVLRKRYFIINTIRNLFEIYGFVPLETPALENIETLMGKYGEEGDKLIFKILNNGLDNPARKEEIAQAFENITTGKNDKNLTSRALRYDLTIPFARFVSMNYHQLPLPYKRYQVQPVWRADRPQRGRYREFFQCDADIAGTGSLLADTELAFLYKDVFEKLNLPVKIRLNNRKILTGLAEVVGQTDHVNALTGAIDKLDKIGKDQVKEELTRIGLDDKGLQIIDQYLSISGSNLEKLAILKKILPASPTGKAGIEELEEVFHHLSDEPSFELDTTLARGLDYYTGTIFEVNALNIKMGSIGGGGRYDNLTGLFGIKGVPGVGISFGIDRIYDVLEEKELFPASLTQGTKALFFNLGKKESEYAFGLMKSCRDFGISCELFYEPVKLDKQFKYAEKKQIPLVVIVGSQELEKGICKVKILATGEEQSLETERLPDYLSANSL